MFACVSCCGGGGGAGLALACLLVLICAISESVRYRVKFLLFVIMSSLATTLVIPLMILRERNWKNALIPARVTRFTAKMLGIKYEIRGRENIPRGSGCVVFINHQSALDLAVLAELWPVIDNGIVIAKREVLFFGLFGLAAWLWGTIFIDRSNPEASRRALNATARFVSERKARLYIFAEGKRHSGTSLMPFKKGGFHVAIDGQVPILPVVVSRYYFLNDKSKRFDSGCSYITILPPILTEGTTKEDLPRLMNETYETMNKKFIETTEENLSRHMDRLRAE